MQVRAYVRGKSNSDILENVADTDIAIDVSEIESRRGLAGGPLVVQISIVKADGKLARFWVRANLKDGNQSRPYVTLSTERGKRTTHKRVTGSFKNYR
jgi:hypothetical protein